MPVESQERNPDFPLCCAVSNIGYNQISGEMNPFGGILPCSRINKSPSLTWLCSKVESRSVRMSAASPHQFVLRRCQLWSGIWSLFNTQVRQSPTLWFRSTNISTVSEISRSTLLVVMLTVIWLEVGAWPGSRTSLESLQIPASDRGISSHNLSTKPGAVRCVLGHHLPGICFQ